MRYNDLSRKLRGVELSSWINFKTNTVKFEWYGCLEPVEFRIKESEEYKTICDKLGYKLSDHRGTVFKDGGDGVVILYPNIQTLGSYRVFWIENNGSMAVVYKDERWLILQEKSVPYYYRSYTRQFDKLLAVYNDNLIYAGGDAVYMLTPKGKIGFVTDYPIDCESNKFTTAIEGDDFITKVYEYYDNDHHHGGWEEYTADLKKALEAIEKAEIAA